MPRVNPEILKWARETAGLSLADAVAKVGLGGARGMLAVERLAALEEGAEQPSRSLLVKMAKQYRRPLLTFYLAAPPRVEQRGSDFRTLPDDYSERDEALVDTLIRDVRARQSMVRSILEDEDEAIPLPFVGAMQRADGMAAILESMGTTLQHPLAEFRRQQTPTGAFQVLRDRAEDAGVFVLLIGNLGSHHTALDVETFRGFAIADPFAPFVVINDQDSRSAWSFTLVHELVHIWLGQTGVSGGAADVDIERFCNDVASEFLLPAHEIDTHVWRSIAGIDALQAAIDTFASERNVSRSMVVYKLYRQGVISRELWNGLSDRFRRLWHEERSRNRERAREQDGGPTFYIVRRHRIGGALIRLTARMLMVGALSTTKAGRVLGVQAKQVGPLIGSYGR